MKKRKVTKSLCTDHAFDPHNFEVRRQIYGDTGGGSMVATTEIYLPQYANSLWVNCTNEAIVVTAADIIWNTDGSNCWERNRRAELFTALPDRSLPDTADTFIPMIKSALEFAIEKEMMHMTGGRTYTIPLSLVPDYLAATVPPDYWEWLKNEGKSIRIGGGAEVAIDPDFGQTQKMASNEPEMEMNP